MAKRDLGKDPRPIPRCMLYSMAVPGGQVFTGEDAIEAALESGDWHDTPPPADKLAQDAGASDSDLASKVTELNQALSTMHSDLKAASTRADDAEAKLAEETKRANAAETKLTAALKKAKGNAG